jgi:nucleoside-diphosphate-sugar epimerase
MKEQQVKSRIIITGGTGFVGSAVYRALSHRNIALLGRENHFHKTLFFKKKIDEHEDYSDCFETSDIVIHCAARAHIMDEKSLDPLVEFRKVNTLGTLNLARQAAASGVKRFIFISSIKVNGESTVNENKYTSFHKMMPEDPYGISKAEAEAGLIDISSKTGMEVVIIRPPLVYGPGVKGNFLKLLRISNRNVPLPFGLVQNKRSMIYLNNLVDFIVTCVDHSDASDKVFLISDGQDLSLKKLLVLIKRSMNRTTILLPVPIIVFKLLGKLMGKQEVVKRLIGNLKIDTSDAKKYLNWTAPHSVEVGIKATVDDFLENQRRL